MRLNCNFWWFARVTLVIGLDFLPQHIWPVVGTYKRCLLVCECTFGGGGGGLILLGGGGNTSTLYYIIKVVSTFCDLTRLGHKT